MPDLGHGVVPSQGAQEVARATLAVLRASAHGQRGAISPLAALILDYERNFSLPEREAVRRAFVILLELAGRSLSDQSYREVLPDMLYFGGRILSVRDTRLMVAIQRSIRRCLRGSLAIGDKDLALSCLNFFASVGMTETAALVQSWAEEIGPQAVVPGFMIMAQRSPAEAIEWILSDGVDADVARKTFKVTLEAIDSGTYAIEAGLTDNRRTNWWAKAQFERALRSSNNSSRKQELLEILNGEEAALPNTPLIDLSVGALRALRDRIPFIGSHTEQEDGSSVATVTAVEDEDDLTLVINFDPKVTRDELMERAQ
jgi:hypothetical protein